MLNELPFSLPHPTPHLATVEALLGSFVPRDDRVQTQAMHRLVQPDRELQLWRVSVGSPAWVQWTLTVVWPRQAQRCPVLLSPDGGWPHVVSDNAVSAVLKQDTALAWFNRTELAFDPENAQRAGPVLEHWPHLHSGCLAIWAWGLQCGVDALLQTNDARMTGIGVVGHSRGGKAALLAAALDARIQAVVSHNSGTAGAASLAVQPPGAETLEQLAQQFPHWLGPDAQQAAVRERIVAEDVPLQLLQHIAPRGLCLLQASDDLWANPEGTRHMAQLLRPHWQDHGHGKGHDHRLQWHERTGGHAMTPADWHRAAHFVHSVLM